MTEEEKIASGYYEDRKGELYTWETDGISKELWLKIHKGMERNDAVNALVELEKCGFRIKGVLNSNGVPKSDGAEDLDRLSIRIPVRRT